MSNPRRHTIVDGESAESIAAHCGLPTESIWDLAANQTLRNLRKDPQILSPGDKLVVPATKPVVYQRATAQMHRFVVHVPKSKLKLRLKKDGEPRANQPCVLSVDGKEIQLSTDGQGNLETPISVKARQARLTVGTGAEQIAYELKLHAMHPASVVTGWQARLQNLGYPVDVDGEASAMSQAALCAFQEAQQLTVSGNPDDATCGRLESTHGC